MKSYRELYPPTSVTETIVCDVVGSELYDDYNDGEIHIKSRDEKGNFKLRNGYWNKIDSKLIKLVEAISNTTIKEIIIEDDDCGELFWYDVKLQDNLINEPSESDLEEMEFVSRWEQGEELF